MRGGIQKTEDGEASEREGEWTLTRKSSLYKGAGVRSLIMVERSREGNDSLQKCFKSHRKRIRGEKGSFIGQMQAMGFFKDRNKKKLVGEYMFREAE